jgi:hypothetical protein
LQVIEPATVSLTYEYPHGQDPEAVLWPVMDAAQRTECRDSALEKAMTRAMTCIDQYVRVFLSADNAIEHPPPHDSNIPVISISARFSCSSLLLVST